jgi:tubulin-specific chaperone D
MLCRVVGKILALMNQQIRADTAERLYIVLQTKNVGRETDEAEDVLLETEW